jgi:DNA adenine methylase
MPKPILKWAGGKTQLLPELTQIIPTTEGTYFEPFIGGGAPFFSFAGQQRFKRAVINDFNPELTNLYQVVRDHPEELREALDNLMRQSDWNTKEYFLQMRASEPDDAISKAVRMVYLNKTAFNGLHRVNKSGRFNVPFGRYTNPKLYEWANLKSCSEALQGVEVRTGDFEDALRDARTGDVVYLDPPYVPISTTANFTAYAGRFGPQEQERLAELCQQLVYRGVYCVQSNSDSPVTRKLYAGFFEIRTVEARRSVNSDATKRGKISELVIVGEPEGWTAQAPEMIQLSDFPVA